MLKSRSIYLSDSFHLCDNLNISLLLFSYDKLNFKFVLNFQLNIGCLIYLFFIIKQVILILTADLDSEEEKDRAALDNLLTTMLKEMNFPGKVSTSL